MGTASPVGTETVTIVRGAPAREGDAPAYLVDPHFTIHRPIPLPCSSGVSVPCARTSYSAGSIPGPPVVGDREFDPAVLDGRLEPHGRRGRVVVLDRVRTEVRRNDPEGRRHAYIR